MAATSGMSAFTDGKRLNFNLRAPTSMKSENSRSHCQFGWILPIKLCDVIINIDDEFSFREDLLAIQKAIKPA